MNEHLQIRDWRNKFPRNMTVNLLDINALNALPGSVRRYLIEVMKERGLSVDREVAGSLVGGNNGGNGHKGAHEVVRGENTDVIGENGQSGSNDGIGAQEATSSTEP